MGAGINVDVCGDILSWFPALYSGRNDSNAARQEVERSPAFTFTHNVINSEASRTV